VDRHGLHIKYSFLLCKNLLEVSISNNEKWQQLPTVYKQQWETTTTNWHLSLQAAVRSDNYQLTSAYKQQWEMTTTNWYLPTRSSEKWQLQTDICLQAAVRNDSNYQLTSA
jgi:hypothetical protein